MLIYIMNPSEITQEKLIEYGIVFDNNGCFPFSVAGAFAFQFPEMSTDLTLRIVRELLKPVRKGEKLFSRTGDSHYTDPYNSITGKCYWAELAYYGFGDDLAVDINNRLATMQVPMSFGILKTRNPRSILGLLDHGATVIPAFSRHEYGSKEVVGFHAMAISKADDQLLMIDSNSSSSTGTDGISWDDLSEVIRDANLRIPYQYSQVLTLGLNIPIVFYFKSGTY